MNFDTTPKRKTSDDGTASAVGSSSPRTLPARSNSEHKKSVTFDDGVKPGAESPPTNVVSTTKNRSASADFDKKFCFDAGFCFSLDRFDEPNDFLLLSKNEEIWTDEKLDEKQKLLETSSDEPIEFRIHNNLLLLGQIFENVEFNLSFGEKKILIFSTRGLSSVAQDELVFVFVEEKIVSKIEFLRELLLHVEKIFRDATKGCFIRHFGLSLNDQNAESFLSSKNSIGFIYVSDFSFSNSILPEFPYLFGVLLHRQELPTAQCFPIRLLTRLGFEFQKYPWSLLNVLDRPTMFTENQNTIMTMLCDFRCFTYTIPTIRGLLISIGNQGSVSIRIPKNRHDEIVKSLDQSSPHALSFGVVNVAEKIHSKQLVTVENTNDHQYKTEIFTSNRSTNEELLVGGNFLVINASLRSRDSPSTSPLDGNFSSSNNLNAKVNTIEDGIMLQLDSETLKILKTNLREGKDYSILAKARPILCEETNSTKRPTSEQLVEFVWIGVDNDVNRGVRSSIDDFPMDGIRSSRIHYAGNSSPLFRIRWTDLFFIQSATSNENSFDPTRFADSLAKSFSKALTPYVEMLIQANHRKLGLRVTVDRENASYMAGSNGEQLSSFFLAQLDDQMIPVVMKASDSFSRESPPLIVELVFYVLN